MESEEVAQTERLVSTAVLGFTVKRGCRAGSATTRSRSSMPTSSAC